jgi:hypothetical protein
MMGLFVFAGCRKNIKNPQKIKNLDIQVLKKEKLDYQQLLALHSEIPDILLGFEVDAIIKDPIDAQALEVIYKPVKNKVINQQEIKKSYVADMEMLGWKMIGEFEGENIQLIFQKAGAKLLSTVVIQHDGLIKVTVYSKK